MDKKITNPINKKDKCFQCAITVALNHEEITKHPERIIKIKHFIDKYNWERINYPSEKDDWNKFDKNYLTIALNVFYAKKEKKYPAYVSKHNSNHEKQVIILMITNGEAWHCLVAKKLSALLIGITSNIKVIFIVWIAFITLEQKTGLNHIKRWVKKNIFVILWCPL